MFTLGNWIVFGVLFIICALICTAIAAVLEDARVGIIGFLVSLIILGIIIGITGWYNTHTAAGQRALKDFQSNIQKGIDREITITAEDGREIFHYEGKVDIESNHTDNYIKFESEEGKRYIIYYGIQDTITIIEK